MAFTNEVIENYRGISIRRYNQVIIRVNVYEYKRFIDAKQDYGMTALEAIRERRALCNICNTGMTFIKAAP